MNSLLVKSIVQAIVIVSVFTIFFAVLGAHIVIAFLLALGIFLSLALLFHLMTLPFFIVARVRGAVYVPSADERIRDMVKLAKVKKGLKVADLGSGDGRVMAAFAKLGATVDGYEINPMLVRRSKQLLKNAGVEKTTNVFWQSFWDVSLEKYDLIIIYGIPYIMEELGQKLKAELKPGSQILSNAFTFPSWKPVKQLGEVREYRM